ncbi:MAG: hypothetical protein WAW80_05060 [Candidatus Saccharimonadales bacterium]
MIAKIKKIILGLMLPVFTVSAMIAPPVSAAPAGCDNGTITFFPRWYDGLCDKNGNIVSPGPGKSSNTADATAKSFSSWISIIALNIVAMLLYAVGYVSLGFVIFGGFKFMISGDNSSGTVAARKTITNALIGLVLSIMAVAIVSFIADAIGGGSGANSGGNTNAGAKP